MQYALGVDIGGTKISVTLGDSSGKIFAKEVTPTRTGRRARPGIDEIAAILQRLKSTCGKSLRLKGIGVGIAGPMDPEKGIVQRSPHLSGWEDFPLKSFLERKLRLPVCITNDANAAAVGEKIFGQGRQAEDFAYLTISTGIGGGIILGGKLLIGSSFGAGEVGHTIVWPGGEKCGCGHRGCLEAYSSGTAIAQFVRDEIRRGRRSKVMRGVRSKGSITGEIVALAAAEKDPLALEAFHRAGYFLGVGLANLINVLNPEMLILGGSVMKSSRFLWASMTQSARQHAWPSLYRACRIVKTRLGDQVGDLGALALVFAHGG
jgi:glucokinase